MTETAFDPHEYTRALLFAARAHAGQTVPGSTLPYLTHVVTVAAEVIAALTVERFEHPNLAVLCALLHDTVEDTDVTREQVAAEFGEAVAAGVMALSKDSKLPKAERMPDSLTRIKAQPREVWAVKLADRITNLSEPPHYWRADKRARYRDEAGRIRAALGDASPYLAARIADRIDAYGRFIEPDPPDGGRHA